MSSSIRHGYRRNNIDLKINGRLFPSWIMANFKRYKLPEIIKKEGQDPCDTKEEINELYKYQQFIGSYLDYESPFREILIYHGLGSGKTASAINIYNVLYKADPAWNIFILIKASLKDNPWMRDLNKWLSGDKEAKMKNIIFVHYDSPFADKDFMNAVNKSESSKKNIYIIDEVHNFISNVYSNINSKSGRRAQNIYDYIRKDKREGEGTRVICLSGTPAINRPFELALLFNLLKPNTEKTDSDLFPMSEAKFNQLYVRNNVFVNKNMFQRNIMGLVSFYVGATSDLFPSKTTYNMEMVMSKFQQTNYELFEQVETKVTKKSHGRQESYRTYTRQGGNFVFPNISQNVTSATRPRPTKFRMDERDAEKLAEKGKLKYDKGSEKFMDVNRYVEAMSKFMRELDKYFSDINISDQKKGYTILHDIKNFKENFKNNYEDFHNKGEHSKLYDAMYKSSCKMTRILFNIMLSEGPVMIYSNYVKMEGIEIMKLYLKFVGFKKYVGKRDGYTYIEFSGDIDKEERTRLLNAYNSKNNIDGSVINIVLISPAGAEGISLMNTRQVHLMEPYWQEVRMIQAIGRAVRLRSHCDLPQNKRHVDVYRYYAIRENGEQTTDQYIYELAKNKENRLQSFLDAIKEVAVDCMLNKNVNMDGNMYRCFQFEEKSLFDRNVGPAYKDDLYDNRQLDNGTNSTNSQTIRIRVMEIRAVKKMEGDTYSKPETYWYYDKSGTVYDHELHYPIGKIAIDAGGIPVKLDKDTYVIDYIIPLPMIE